MIETVQGFTATQSVGTTGITGGTATLVTTPQSTPTLTAILTGTSTGTGISRASAAGQSTAGVDDSSSDEAIEIDEPDANAVIRLDLSLTQEERDTANQSSWLRLIAIPAGIALAGLGGYGIWRRTNRLNRT